MKSYLLLPSARRVFPARRAFTLVEMFVVMAVIVLMLGISKPALTGLTGAGEVNKAVYDIAGILEQARAYAMSNGTYVYVGFQEADATASESGRQSNGVGRVSVAVIAARDGSRGYDVNNASASWASNYAAGKNFVTIGKVQRFRNLHLVNLGARPVSGGMVRPPSDSTAAIDTPYNLGDPSCASVTTFEYPVGTAVGGGQYSFIKVIQFDSQGVARIQQAANGDTIAHLMEIGLQQTHGTVIPALSKQGDTGGIAAIQIDGMSGASHIYRP